MNKILVHPPNEGTKNVNWFHKVYTSHLLTFFGILHFFGASPVLVLKSMIGHTISETILNSSLPC